MPLDPKDLSRIPVKHNLMTPHQMERSLRSLGLMVEGYKWREIENLGGYNWSMFSKLMAKFPDLAKAWSEARKTSAQVFEDKALQLADELVQANEFTGTQVRAHEVAMGQYRWSAARRDPGGFADASMKSVSAIIPVQINTTLNLGQEGGGAQEVAKTVWEVHAEWKGPLADEGERTEAPVIEGEILPEEPKNPLAPAPGLREPLPENLEALRVKLGMPEALESAVKRRVSKGPLRKGHKDAAGTGITAGRYAKMKKSPAVKAALGIKDDGDGIVEYARGQFARPRKGAK